MIIATFVFNNITARGVGALKNNTRFISFQKLQKTCYDYIRRTPSGPPYKHMCQIGDPVLRMKSTPVSLQTIRTPEFQKVLRQLSSTLRNYGALGISAPQIGLPWQVFAVEVTDDLLKKIDPKVKSARDIEVVPLKYFINPNVKIVDHTMLSFPEICGSVVGFHAVVPRAKEVEVTAINESGESFTWLAKGWSARIVQHEFDHLQGKCYIDKMDVKTFSCSLWEEVNKYGGYLELPYRPK